MKGKVQQATGISLILIIALGSFLFLLPQIEAQQANPKIDKDYWMRMANNAWKYFQPGIGVDSTTGLDGASVGYPYFTDWDLATYIQSIIDANQLGILGNTGPWGADERINKILTFLETRQLTSDGIPYTRYQSGNGKPYEIKAQDAADTGQLLVSLSNLKVAKPQLTERINTIVYNRTNYAPLQQQVDYLKDTKHIYNYYVASGFAHFWPNRFSNLPTTILNNILTSDTVTTYGVALPISTISCEPLLLSIFNLEPNNNLNNLAQKIYLAHEARYNTIGKFTAFSEGAISQDNLYYIYEWVVKPDGSTWTIENVEGERIQISPIIYFKVATSFLAIFNTKYSYDMVSYLESKFSTPSRGYSEGIDENGRITYQETDKTNSMIISAALYAIDNLQHPTPTPTSTPTSTPKPTATTMPSATPDIPSSTTTPTISPLPSPTGFQPTPSATQFLTPITTQNINPTPTADSITSNPSTSQTNPTSPVDPQKDPAYGSVFVFILIAMMSIVLLLLAIVLIATFTSKKRSQKPSIS